MGVSVSGDTEIGNYEDPREKYGGENRPDRMDYIQLFSLTHSFLLNIIMVYSSTQWLYMSRLLFLSLAPLATAVSHRINKKKYEHSKGYGYSVQICPNIPILCEFLLIIQTLNTSVSVPLSLVSPPSLLLSQPSFYLQCLQQPPLIIPAAPPSERRSGLVWVSSLIDNVS